MAKAETKFVGFRMDVELYKKLFDLARREDRTVSNMIVTILRRK